MEDLIRYTKGDAPQDSSISQRHFFQTLDHKIARILCDLAAVWGELEMLQWLHNSCCPWNADTLCFNAAISGNRDMILWLREHKVPWGCLDCKSFTDFCVDEYQELDEDFIIWLALQDCPLTAVN